MAAAARRARAPAIPAAAGLAAALAVLAATGGAGAPDAAPGALAASALAAGGSPPLGDPSAPVTILEWGDYQCTYCRMFHESGLPWLKAEYLDAGRAKLVFKDFPLNGPGSAAAAEASHCAGDQGLYWEYHGALYGNWAGEGTGWITGESLARFAAGAGADAAEFAACMEEGRHGQRVLDMERLAAAAGVDATPTFLVFDGERAVKIRGNQPPEAFRQAMAEIEGGAG